MIGGFGLAGGGMKGMGQVAAARHQRRSSSRRIVAGKASAFEIDEMAFGLTIERITDETKAGQERSVIVNS